VAEGVREGVDGVDIEESVGLRLLLVSVSVSAFCNLHDLVVEAVKVLPESKGQEGRW